jgi:hypothetical protein
MLKDHKGEKLSFFYSVKQMSLDGKKGLRQDVPTRWNSTFLILESAIFYRRAFHHLELTDSNFKLVPLLMNGIRRKKSALFLLFFMMLRVSFLAPNIQQPTYIFHQFSWFI